MYKEVLTTYEIAKYCHVTPRTVIQWVNEGKLKAFRTPGNHSRINMGDFLDFLRRYNMPIPSDLTDKNYSGRKRVLIVDDEKGVVDAIQRFLRIEKIYDLEAAFDGFEAGHKFADFKPDLIILDIRMPGLDGYQVCSRIRSDERNRNVKILLISGGFEEKEISRIQELGADDYLAKPFSNEELRIKVMNLLDLNRRAEDKPLAAMEGK
jgi:excisionase family DNA binding protein